MGIGDIAANTGFPCFPCGEDKRPVIANGFKAASADRARIIAMFDRPGAALIGVPTGETTSMVVIDVDIRSDRTGMDWLNENQNALPETRTHKTRSGGLHLLFKYPVGHDIRNSAGRIAPGIDVRANGGFIIIPPSPGYVVADHTEMADMPRWLIRACMPAPAAPQPTPSKAVHRASGGTHYGLAALQGECDAIRRAGYGQQEQTLNDAALKIGALVAGGEIEEGIAMSDLRAAGNAMSSESGREPWQPDEIDAKVRRAMKHGASRPRAPAPRPEPAYSEPPPPIEDEGYWQQVERDDQPEMDDTPPEFGGEIPKEEDPKTETAAPIANPLPLTYFNDLQPNLDCADFVEGLLIDASMAVVYGESNCGKTFFVSDLGLHVALGWPWRGREVEQGGVIYCALEGSHGIANRVAAFRMEHGLEGSKVPFAVVPYSLNMLNPDADTPRLIQTIKDASEHLSIPVRLVVIDTLARALAGGNENASEDMGAVVINTDKVRAATKACVVYIHHSGKDTAKGARGHSSLRAATDTEIEITRADNESPSIARAVKQREMDTSGEFAFKLKVIELGVNRRGKAVTSCVIETVGEEEKPVVKTGQLSASSSIALRILSDVIASNGRNPPALKDFPEGVQVVPVSLWRQEYYRRAEAGSTQDAKQKAFRRAVNDLGGRRVIASLDDFVWTVKGEKS